MRQRESDWQMLWSSDGWELKGLPCMLASERGWAFNVILLYCNAPSEDLEMKKFLEHLSSTLQTIYPSKGEGLCLVPFIFPLSLFSLHFLSSFHHLSPASPLGVESEAKCQLRGHSALSSLVMNSVTWSKSLNSFESFLKYLQITGTVFLMYSSIYKLT